MLRTLQTLFNTGGWPAPATCPSCRWTRASSTPAAPPSPPNPIYFDPENIVKLAIEGGCNAVASTLGVLGAVARKYAHKIPFIVKINHNEMLTYPDIYDQTLFASVEQAFDMGAVAVGATIYFGSPESRRQIQEISEAFAHAHELGMVTVLWAYLRNPGFKKDGVDYHTAADLTGQANHLAVTIEADIVKQKQAENNGGYNAIKFGKTHPKVYSELTSDHPIDLVRYQVANCYMGRAGLINSGGASGERRPGAGGAHGGHQQARRRHGADLRPQGVPEADGGRRDAAERDPGRVSGEGCDDRVTKAAGTQGAPCKP